MKIRHLFFDLDHTLWDFEKNSQVCLQQIFDKNDVIFTGKISFQEFNDTFSVINKGLWDALDQGQITHEYLRKIRFQKVLSACDIHIDEETSFSLNDMFLNLLPHQKLLMDDALATLQALEKKAYKMHIISNGYHEIQKLKMESSGILHFFECIVTNDIAGSRKPEKEIYEYALNKANAHVSESVMIGDNLVADIEGAQKAGWKTVHFDINGAYTPNTKINALSQLLEIF
ncbi:YjjG family noncanonical pyrimidine nucleotidase [Lacihabitans sp. LS3-19]|uniref:YjjG family noncanonical pyrimidine nucleotidase n=1 Tax=Lacihabitans sp. LS3-19 TaxID=2487335 RepID=UPI0020CE96CC|nr:YjjG family noncanonical pyrimidine nucleotidase [Lacihabitans sp. LS3-19]